MPGTSKNRAFGWSILAVLIVLTVYLYVFCEWLFFVTKPSFLSRLHFIETLRVLFVTPLPFVVAGITALTLLWVPVAVVRKRVVQRVGSIVAVIVMAAVLSATFFLLADNFTYTLFDFGVRMAGGIGVFAYMALMVILFALSYRLLSRLGTSLRRRVPFRTAGIAAICLVVVSIVFALASLEFSRIDFVKGFGGTTNLGQCPNIIIVSADGLNADHMSVYGYHRDTTPFLKKQAGNILVCENCFVNADVSSSSIVSFLTGKLPTQTKLIRSPNILRGIHSYQHLPGILKAHGYRNIDISIRTHADPVDLNMRNAFDWVNSRETKENWLVDISITYFGELFQYFTEAMRGRITDRVFHVFGVKKMEDPLAEVVKGKNRYSKDAERIQELISQLRASSSPLFAHVHLVGTHGPQYRLTRRMFSGGKKQAEPWETDFYDDAVLNFDFELAKIMKTLSKEKISRETVVIVCADHGMDWAANVRTPLIFLFPDGEYRGRISSNIQNIDIAPTILDYLGLEKPAWMGGQSLLSMKVDPHRFIFAAGRKDYKMEKMPGGRRAAEGAVAPPFYSLGTVYVTFCQRQYALNLESETLTVYDIEGHTAPCPEADLPDPQDVGQMIIDHLAGNGYDVSSLETPFAVRHQNKGLRN